METTKLQMNRDQIGAMVAVIKLEAMQILSHGMIKAVKKSKDEREYLMQSLAHVIKNVEQWNSLVRPFEFALGQFEENGRNGEALNIVVPTADIRLYANLLRDGSFNIALSALEDGDAPEEIRENDTLKVIQKYLKELVAIFDTGAGEEELKEDKRFIPMWAQKAPPKDMLN
jgi:hypothetical protein